MLIYIDIVMYISLVTCKHRHMYTDTYIQSDRKESKKGSILILQVSWSIPIF